MMNLWEETIKVLEKNKKSFDDIEFVTVDGREITKSNFKELATKTNYDNGFGLTYVNLSLSLVGDDFWLSRDSYEGAESWKFFTKPSRPNKVTTVDTLIIEEQY